MLKHINKNKCFNVFMLFKIIPFNSITGGNNKKIVWTKNKNGLIHEINEL